MRAVHVLALVLALCSASGCSPAGSSPEQASDEPDAETTDRIESDSPAEAGGPEAINSQRASRLGDGFVVWESNRSENWRIWIRDLEPSAPRRLSPEESGREHCCAHISPDGRWITYLSYAESSAGYAKGGSQGVLHRLRADGTDDRIVATKARSSWENRAAVWKSDHELIYIRGDGATVLHDLDDDRSEVLARSDEHKTWLINSRLTHAVSGVADFAPYDRTGRAIAQRRAYGGCQPYFSHDGRWAFWAAGTGGPIQRLDLATSEVSTILAKSDSRIPDGLGYAYFPMLSRDARLFAFAASDYQHDHFRADYEIFVAESDPETLELQGQAVRMTSHPATDRFPDAFLAPLALGRHRAEAPFSVGLEAALKPGGTEHHQSLAWDFGDGHRETPASDRDTQIRHTYELPGRYEIRARTASGQTLRGQVEVLPAAPPRVLGVELRDEGRSVVVRFDEPIHTDPGSTTARFASGAAVTGLSVGGNDRSLVIELARRIDGFDRLELDGVSDRAQRPNETGPLSFEIDPPLWPSNRSGLTFLWETGEGTNLVQGQALGSERTTTVTAAGMAFLDHDFAMALRGGHFFASVADVTSVLEASKRSNQLTLELVLRPEPDESTRLRRIVSFSAGTPRSRNFLLGHRDSELIFALRSGNPLDLGEIEVARVPTSELSHWVLSYEVGRLTAYLDGEPILDSDALQGDFFQWKPRPLLFGNSPKGSDPWSGRLEGIAIYSRAVGPDEARENSLRYRRQIAERGAVPQSIVEATLVAFSQAPSLEEITPYREALAVFEYRVDRVLAGASPGDTVRVAHWSIRDGALLEVNGSPQVGGRSRLTLEPFARNRQLESLYLADTLAPRGGSLYFAVP